MTVTPIHQAPAPDRAMRPEVVAQEICGGAVNRAWVLRNFPDSCRVPHNTRPPLFWASKSREWWEKGKAKAS
jgi:hypothetical protein